MWDFVKVYKFLIGKVKKSELESSQLFLVKGREAVDSNRNPGNSI